MKRTIKLYCWIWKDHVLGEKVIKVAFFSHINVLIKFSYSVSQEFSDFLRLIFFGGRQIILSKDWAWINDFSLYEKVSVLELPRKMSWKKCERQGTLRCYSYQDPTLYFKTKCNIDIETDISRTKYRNRSNYLLQYLATNVCLVKAMVFPIVLYGCKSCIVK